MWAGAIQANDFNCPFTFRKVRDTSGVGPALLVFQHEIVEGRGKRTERRGEEGEGVGEVFYETIKSMTGVDAVARDRGEPVCFLNADRNSFVPQFEKKLPTYFHDANLPFQSYCDSLHDGTVAASRRRSVRQSRRLSLVHAIRT